MCGGLWSDLLIREAPFDHLVDLLYRLAKASSLKSGVNVSTKNLRVVNTFVHVVALHHRAVQGCGSLLFFHTLVSAVIELYQVLFALLKPN